MKQISFIVAAVVVVFMSVWLWPKPPAKPSEGLTFNRANIVIHGKGYTPARVAEEVDDPTIFDYDPNEHKVFCNANLIVKGELLIGDSSGPRTVFEFNTTVCGDRMLNVRSSGRVVIKNTEMATVDRQLRNGICPRGYAVVCGGEMVAHDSDFLFVTGSVSRFLRDDATAEILRCKFEGGDTASFTTLDLDGEGVEIADCMFDFRGVSNNGLAVSGKSEHPIVLKRCVLSGRVNALLNQGYTDVVLLDCSFPRKKLKFSQATGTARVKHTVRFRVTGSAGEPVEGVFVSARSIDAAPVQEADGAKTGPDGECSIALTSYVASKAFPVRTDGDNNATPHIIIVRSADGEELARVDNIDAADAGRKDEPVAVRIVK